MLDRLLLEASRPREPQTLASYLELTRELAGLASPMERAALAGARSDRVGFAFAGGYQAAIAALFPLPSPGCVGVLSVTEERGGHPRAIAARIENGKLSGQKRWATLAPHADVIFVVASEGADEAGRNRLKVVCVDPRAKGVTITAMPETPFAPEVPHTTLTLSEVSAPPGAILDGDGYDRYVKPFRTVEDLHVFAALTGYLVGEGCRGGWPDTIVERLLAVVSALRGAATLAHASPGLHLAIAGILATARPLFEEATAQFSEEAPRARWVRDIPLLFIAEKARHARRVGAWRAAGRSGP